MTARSRPPFRADHVGSLLRPEPLRRARAQFADGVISAAQLRAVEDDEIRGAVDMQRRVGLRSATDGEFRRTSWHMDFIYQLQGVSRGGENMRVSFRNAAGEKEFSTPGLRVDGKVGLGETIFGDDFSFLRSQTSATPKQTIPSPSMVYYRGGRAAVDENVYPDLEQFYADLSAAYAAEITAMGQLGCTYLQLDDTSLAYLNDPNQREMIARLGGDADTQHLRNIKQINTALRGKPDGMSVTTHMCRGNFRSSWVAEGSYEFVAEALFNELAVDGFFLEYDDERSGGFEPLRFMPKDKYVVLGLVTTKRGELESVADLERRIDEASRYIDIDQLCLSPQCGFSSTVEGNDLSQGQQANKLSKIVEIAANVWGE